MKAVVATDADETCSVAATEPLVYKATRRLDLDMDGHSVMTETLDHNEDPEEYDNDGRDNSDTMVSIRCKLFY